jgi:hypothetical protein
VRLGSQSVPAGVLLTVAMIVSLTLCRIELAAADGCAGQINASNGEGTIRTGATVSCGAEDGSSLTDGEQGPPTKTYDCGPRSTAGGVVNPLSDTNCSATLATCMLAPGEKAIPNTTVMLTITQQPDGTWVVSNIDCAAPIGAATPQLTAADVRQEAQKLVPHPGIGIAPPNGTALVNIETVLWVDTATNRSLGTVTLLGHQVELRVAVSQVTWSFGDGSSETIDSAGVPYDPVYPCSAKLCERYWGHVYTSTGALTLTATVTWTGQFRVDGGAWQTIPGTVTGPATSTTLTVREARGVLVRD